MNRPLPPHQQLIRDRRWPVVGEKGPRGSDDLWSLSITGAVTHPITWSLEELSALPQVQRTIDLHCVTRWTKHDVPFEGVPLGELLTLAGPLPHARYISCIARSNRQHSSSMVLDELLGLEPLVALRVYGELLSVEHGGPMRLVVPERYFYKSVKWVTQIELLEHDRLGYWEAEAGYHNHADPWREERYLASNLARHQVQQMIDSKHLPPGDYRGFAANRRDLARLQACDALLRDADFRDANLREANFARANLTNAHFNGACLAHASFADADIEGADFSGADLRGANLEVASMFGATFCHIGPDGTLRNPAKIDRHTRWNNRLFDSLVDEQQAFIQNQLLP